jgi:hypothetical protein
MAKRTREEGEAGGRAEAAVVVPFAAPAASTAALAAAECEFCLRLFHPRGLKIHQSRCKAKAARQGGTPLSPQQKKDQRRTKYLANKKQKRDELEAFLRMLSPAFVTYAKSNILLKHMSKSELEVCSPRFDELVEALKKRGLELPTDSSICSHYIAQEFGRVGQIVDNTEEKAFLLSHTDYLARSSEDIEAGREDLGEWCPSEDEDMMVANCREDAKAALCVEFLLNNRGLTLPRKWEDCRARLEEVRADGDSLMEERLYIYTGSSDEYIASDYY